MAPVVLECKTCGRTLRVLSEAEQAQMDRNPRLFPTVCRPCGQAEQKGK